MSGCGARMGKQTTYGGALLCIGVAVKTRAAYIHVVTAVFALLVADLTRLDGGVLKRRRGRGSHGGSEKDGEERGEAHDHSSRGR